MKTNYIFKLKEIQAFVFDIDGVLTDGTVTIMPDGEQIRRMNIKDGYALQLAVKKGYKVGIISGGSSESVRSRFEGLGITDIYLRTKDKVERFEEFCTLYDLKPEHILYMGDDIPDYDVMQLSGIAACPHDAAKEIIEVSDYISEKKGGQGCVRDVIEKTLTAQNNWFDKEKSGQFNW